MWWLPDCRQRVPVLQRDPVDLPVPHADLHATRFGIQIIRQLKVFRPRSNFRPFVIRHLPRKLGLDPMAINPKVRIVGIPLWPYSDIQNLRGAEGLGSSNEKPV